MSSGVETPESSSVAASDDPVLARLQALLPPELLASYSPEQIAGIRILLSEQPWRKRTLDLSGTFALPLIKRQFYYVIQFGRDNRIYSRRERHVRLLIIFGFIVFLCGLSILLALFGLYLLKSAMGMDFIPGASLGVWDWFREFINDFGSGAAPQLN